MYSFGEIRLSSLILRSFNILLSGICMAYRYTRRSELERLPPLSGRDVLIIFLFPCSLSIKYNESDKTNAKEKNNRF